MAKRSRPAKSVEAPRKRARPVAQAPKVSGPWWRTDDRMPMQWPNGSAVTRGSHSKKFKPHNRTIGEPEEENPNLMGRIVNDRTDIDPGYKVWRWLAKKYHYVGTYPTFREALHTLSERDRGRA